MFGERIISQGLGLLLKQESVDSLLAPGIEDVGLRVIEGKGEFVADLDLVSELDLRDEIDAAEVGVDIVLVAKKLSDGDADVISAFCAGGDFFDVLRA